MEINLDIIAHNFVDHILNNDHFNYTTVKNILPSLSLNNINKLCDIINNIFSKESLNIKYKKTREILNAFSIIYPSITLFTLSDKPEGPYNYSYRYRLSLSEIEYKQNINGPFYHAKLDTISSGPID